MTCEGRLAPNTKREKNGKGGDCFGLVFFISSCNGSAVAARLASRCRILPFLNIFKSSVICSSVCFDINLFSAMFYYSCMLPSIIPGMGTEWSLKLVSGVPQSNLPPLYVVWQVTDNSISSHWRKCYCFSWLMACGLILCLEGHVYRKYHLSALLWFTTLNLTFLEVPADNLTRIGSSENN